MRTLTALFLFALAACSSISRSTLPTASRPLLIAHRGLPGHLPEHTLEGYNRAIELGADFIEPDLVPTKDGVLVARHENEISGTTDVAAKFPSRKATKEIDGQKITGWFTEDFTLAELKTLRARERLATRSHAHDGQFSVPTLEEILDLAARNSREMGRAIGVYPETKHASYFRSIGLELEPRLIAILEKRGYTGPDAPVIIQSFEPSSLQRLRAKLGVRLVQLLEEDEVAPYDFVLAKDPRKSRDLMTSEGLAEIAKYANGIGPYKLSVYDPKSDTHTDLVERAHKAGLFVHPYTFRSDAPYLDKRYKGNPQAEYLEYFRAGVDGLFSDFTDDAAQARALWLQVAR